MRRAEPTPTSPEPIVLVITALADRPDADGQWYAQITDPARHSSTCSPGPVRPAR